MSELRDPRVLFAAERTLLAWNRTALAAMAFGFAIERFGLFMRMMERPGAAAANHGPSFWVGIALVVLGALMALLSVGQYRRVLATLNPDEVPARYAVNLATYATLGVAAIGAILAAYLFLSSM